jgi:cellulose synthase/poly-beta-1,6-N-acetylglucosamine synthase-like glycosyltransferase
LSVDEASFEYFLWNFAAEKIHFFREPNSASKDLCMLAFSEPSGGILGCMEKISVDYSLTEEKNAILLMQSIARLISANHKMQRLIDLFPSKQVKGTSIGREFTFRIHHHSRNNVSSYDVLNGRFISRNKSYHCIPFEFYNDFVLKRLDNLNFIGKLAQNHSRLLTRQGDPLLNSWLSGIQPQDWSSCTSAMSVFSRNIDFLIDSTMKTGECFHVEFFESGRVGKPNDFPAKPVILFPIEMDCIRKIVPSVFDSGDSEQLNYDSISSILSLNLGFQRKIDWDFDRQGRLLIGQIAWRFLMNKLSAKPADSVALSTKISPKIPDILVKSDNSINSKSPVVRRRGSVRNIRDTNDPNMWMGTQVDGLASSEKTKSRKFWLYISWMLTFWLTDCFLVQILGKKNATVRMAFREKLSLCILFGIANATCIVVLLLVNPNWTSNNRLIFQQDFKRIARRTPSLLMVFRSGRIWTIGAKVGSNDPRFDQIVPFVGLDVTRYPRTDYQSINQCPQLTNTNARSARDAAKMINTTGQPLLTTPRNALDDPSLYDTETLYAYMAFYREDVLWRQDFVNHSSVWLMANKNIYNLTEYFSRSYLPFFSEQTESIFKRYAGKELPPEVQTNLEAGVLECLDQLFMAGKLGFQPSIVENLLQNIITGALVISLLIIYVKFAAGAPIPRWTKHNKPFVQYIQQYVIMFVPCYTEHRQSLEQTIRSLAESDYPDDKKLIFVVCDGMVAGESSNGVLTPRIVLDILGSSGSLDDAQSFPFDSTGESHSAYNEAKVYTGYFVSGAHRVPYFVIVKIGHPSEQKKPGNRGKRDSQAILMTFLSKVYYQQLMNPLELEIFYQMHHFLNIRPEWYEYVLMVDADTVVSRNGLAELMNQIAFDPDMLGICGETTVANPFASFITAVQVFEYFISHRLSKAFESLFGIVTCLPGCFSLWRIKSKERNMAILASKDIIVEFKSSRTDTLHSKNLLLLGEDRYLTTLMLKNFSGMSTCFNSAATCKTSVPTSFNVLLSQRRRWINSTIHNLAELLFLNSFSYGLVGTRFLMLIDLVSNILLPGSFVFMIVMIYQSIISPVLPYIALLLTGCFYGVQALLVILSGHFSQLGWMICYLIGSVMFHFVFPIYAFWHFDNFTCKFQHIKN